jgi:hypothetical protein
MAHRSAGGPLPYISKTNLRRMNRIIQAMLSMTDRVETIKMFPQKPEPILLELIFGRIASFGCNHAVNVQVPTP